MTSRSPVISIRPAAPGDVPALALINLEVQALHVASRPDQFKPSQPSEIEQWLANLLENTSAKLWVAEKDGTLAGYVVVMPREKPENPFCPARKWWDVDQIGVRASDRRSGVGGALIQKVIAEARAQRIDELELNSWSFNQNAHAAFSRLGFVPKSVRFELRVAEPTET
jgi:GNAT superfamily N-acetyltransferase